MTLLALDSGNFSILTLLDLSAAFNTVDHHTLFNTILNYFGISGSALVWFQSYLLTELRQSLWTAVSPAELTLCTKWYKFSF